MVLTTTKLEDVLSRDLNFHDKKSMYGSHNLHPFPAKFPPQLPALFIEELTNHDDIVFDPMMGSGTTIVESINCGRETWGMDFDSLAHLITKVKITSIDSRIAGEIFDKVINRAKSNIASSDFDILYKDYFDQPTQDFIRFWFFPRTAKELFALKCEIDSIDVCEYRDFFKLVFSSTIIAKTGGVSRAVDLAHSRPHLDPTKKEKDCFKHFEKRFRLMIDRIPHEEPLLNPILKIGDVRNMPFPNGKVSLIVTSPPYPLNAIDYVRVNKFSLIWFGEKIKNLTKHRSLFIGSEIQRDLEYDIYSQRMREVIEAISEKDEVRLRYYFHYLNDMGTVFEEFNRVLRPGGIAILVAGSSFIRGVDTLTQEFLREIASQLGFEIPCIVERELDRNRRMMPARNGKAETQIEKRMHKEFIIPLVKE